MIIVDTSCWIDYFRGVEPFASKVAYLIESDTAVLIGPVITEILRGIVKSSVRTRINEFITGLTTIKQPVDLWNSAGLVGAAVTKRGYNPKTVDLLIAIYALDTDLPLLTKDRDFQLMQKAGVPIRLVTL